MQVLRWIPPRPLKLPDAVAAIGVFDGVHLGHQAILAKAVARAKARRGAAIAVTFHPHPLAVVRPSRVPPLLLPLDQRLRLLAASGVRATLVVPFTRAFSRWPPEAFVRRLLVERLNVREVVVGWSGFRFGADRRGNVARLRALGERHGFRVHAVPPVRVGGKRVSSGRIRRLIASGRLRQAERFLGRPVTVAGRVVHGAHRGRALGFPTANLRVVAGMLPHTGVYAVRVRWNRRLFKGMANLGFRPTFRRTARSEKRGARSTPSPWLLAPRPLPLLEVHLFGLRHRSLFGQRLEVAFGPRLRAERRFPSAAALARQLARDARQALLAQFH